MEQSLEWTPEEIRGQRFRGVFGYSKKEVREFLATLSKRWSVLRQREQEQGRRLAELEKEVANWRAREQELTVLLQSAQAEAARLREEAKTEAQGLLLETEVKAGSIRKRTETWLEEVIAKVEETQRQKQNFLTAFRSALDSHYELIKEEEQDQEPLTARLAEVLRERKVEPPPLS